MLNIGNTLYLLAALGILVPLLIHLWNRKPLRVIEVGSIRWLKGSSTRSTRKLRLEEWPLLLLRCLILLLFSLLLAGLYWERSREKEVEKASYYLIHPKALQQLSRQAVDSLERSGLKVRLLAPGMPSLSDSLLWQDKAADAVDIWAVMREADRTKEVADTVRLHTPLLQAAFSGERPALDKIYIFEERGFHAKAGVVHAEAIQLGHEIFLQQAVSGAESIRFKKDTISGEEWSRFKKGRALTLSKIDTLKLSIVADERYQRDGELIKYALEAALEADPSTKLLLNTQMEEASGSDVVVYLSDQELSASLLDGKPLVIRYAEPEEFGGAWLRPDFSNPDRRVYLLTERVLPEKVSRDKLSRLPQELARILKPDEQQRISGYLPMPVAQALPLRAGGSRGYQEPVVDTEDLHEWLWLLLFGLFVTERIWVYLK
jgi:hypothetical protein